MQPSTGLRIAQLSCRDQTSANLALRLPPGAQEVHNKREGEQRARQRFQSLQIPTKEATDANGTPGVSSRSPLT